MPFRDRGRSSNDANDVTNVLLLRINGHIWVVFYNFAQRYYQKQYK